MASIIIYNVWQLANLPLAKKLRRALEKSLLKARSLAVWLQSLA
ncbi:MAG: hypothetical protein QXI39_01845 [Candidatus Bathyarchaeia archaeon]